MRKRAGRAEQSWFLITRGVWLLFIELFVMQLAFTYMLSYPILLLQVIWAFGWCMIALAALIHLPDRALLVFSLGMIALHNTLDGVTPAAFGSFGWLWQVLHVPSFLPFWQGKQALALYPLIPWIGVMSAGYCFGRVIEMEPNARRQWLLRWGTAAVAAFFVIRFLNVYGDPGPWSPQGSFAQTVMSFLRVNKYPPSLLYLLMTLGPGLLFLGLTDRVRVSANNALLVFGRVPLFYYIPHFFLAHGLAILLAWFRYGNWTSALGIPAAPGGAPSTYPMGYGYNLAIVYLIWAALVASLYLPCRWYGRIKYQSRSRWFSYL
jgi:uncharacterized membrane protein